MFSKSYCGFSRIAKEAMARNLPAEAYLVVELDRREDGPQIQEVLRGITVSCLFRFLSPLSFEQAE